MQGLGLLLILDLSSERTVILVRFDLILFVVCCGAGVAQPRLGVVLPVLRVLVVRAGGLMGQGAGSAQSRWWAVVIRSAQGQAGSMCRTRRRAVRMIRPATARMRSRIRFGS